MPQNDPLARGAAPPLPEIGEGCVRRFDPQALSDELGTDFAQARRLWLALQATALEPPATTCASGAVSPSKPE